MRARGTIRQRTIDAIITGIVMCLIVYFGYHAVQGDLGLLAYIKVNQQIESLEAEAAIVSAEREALERRVVLMSPDGVDPDLLDERVRYDLGYAHPDDLVIFTPSSN